MTAQPATPRRAVLDLAPLELDCMNTLWPMGEGTVRQIRDHLAARRPRAYTTIMTIMDRLARKGIVERRKFGRAYIYRPNLSAEEARAQALGQVVDSFFGGSREALLRQLVSTSPQVASSTSSLLSVAASAGAASSPAASHSAPRPAAAVLTMPARQAAPQLPHDPPPTRPLPSTVLPASPPVSASQPGSADSIDDTLL